LRDAVAQRSRTVEVQCHRTKPCFAEGEEPGSIAVSFRDLLAGAHHAYELSPPTGQQQRQRFPAESEKIHHHGGRLVHRKDARLELSERFAVVASKHFEMGIDHPVIWREAGGAQIADPLPCWRTQRPGPLAPPARPAPRTCGAEAPGP